MQFTIRLLHFVVCLTMTTTRVTAAAPKTSVPEAALLRSQFDTKVKQEVQQPYDKAIARLNASYASSLDRALATAQKSGSLDEAVALKAESNDIAAGRGVPVKDDSVTPTSLVHLRDDYRHAIHQIETERAQCREPLQAAFLQSLDDLIAKLTKEGRLDDATAVRKQRDAIAIVVEPQPTRVGRSPVPPPPPRTLTKAQLIAHPWKYLVPTDKLGAAVLTFNADKTLVSNKNGKGSKGTWSIKNDILRLEVTDIKFWAELSLAPTPSDSGITLTELTSVRGKRPYAVLVQVP